MVKAVQNDTDMVKNVRSQVAEEATQEIFDTVIKWDNYSEIANDISAAISAALKDKEFFDNLQLTQKQKDLLDADMQKLVLGVVSRYREKVKEDERTKKIAQSVVINCRKIIDASFEAVAKEINRGSVINGRAVSANSANEKYNKLEFRYVAGDVCVPTNGIFISTNCIDVIKNSTQVVYHEKTQKRIATVTPVRQLLLI